MSPVSETRAVAGRGLDGDRYYAGTGHYSNAPSPGGGRGLTLIENEVLDSLAAEHRIALAPSECRRNIVTRGVRLLDLIGKQFRIGDALCKGVRICEPCLYLERLTSKRVSEPLIHRAGLRADILEGGLVRLGDSIEVREADPS